MKILLIEDEKGLREVITRSLQNENYLVETASDFATAAEKVELYDYDCILLDIMLPGGNGLTILESLKASNKQNVIIISAKDSVDDKVKGLNLGADDYLAKPFHLAELTARIKSVIRRNSLEGSSTVEFENISINLDQRALLINNNDVPLNRKEFDLLSYLVMNKNRLVSKTALAEHIWGDNVDQADDFEFIYSQIKNLRKKLKDHAAKVEIQAVYGIGYKLTAS